MTNYCIGSDLTKSDYTRDVCTGHTLPVYH